VSPNEQKSKVSDIFTNIKQMLFEELANIFLKEVKNHITGPCIYHFLGPLLHKKSKIITETLNNIPSATNFLAEFENITIKMLMFSKRLVLIENQYLKKIVLLLGDQLPHLHHNSHNHNRNRK
jgi:hypothetical protein